MKLSIVATLYQSGPYLREFHRRASEAARKIAGDDFEVVLVNDGSPDDSLEAAIELHRRDPHVVVVDLSRNFGHHKAMMTGLAHARGDLVFLIDSDLEEEPEWVTHFLTTLHENAADVVFGVQAQRKGSWFEKITGPLFYTLFRFLTGIPQPSNIVTARLMTRRYVNALLSHGEREINIGGLWLSTGFHQIQQVVTKHSTSPTTYSLRHKFSHLVNAVTSFSNLPLIFTFYAGLFFSSSALVYILFLVFRYLSISTIPGGYTSLIVSIWFFSGLIILFVGIQGIYLSKIFSEVKQRPLTIVRSVHHQKSQGTPS